jgi:hypothetical protein
MTVRLRHSVIDSSKPNIETEAPPSRTPGSRYRRTLAKLGIAVSAAVAGQAVLSGRPALAAIQANGGNDNEVGNFTVQGNLGVGTTTPAYPLHVVGGGLIQGVVSFGSSAGISLYDNSAQAILQWNGGRALVGWDSANGARFYISPAGYFGIGTSNPVARLDVVGAIAVNGVVAIDSSGQAVHASTAGSASQATHANTADSATMATIAYYA